MSNKWFDLDWILPIISGFLSVLLKVLSSGGFLFFAIGSAHYAFVGHAIPDDRLQPILCGCALAGIMWSFADDK